MMFRKYLKSFVIGVLLILTIIVVVIGLIIDRKVQTRKTVRPRETEGSAFGNLTRIGGTGWEIGSLFLSFKGIESGDGNLYVIGELVGFTEEDREIQIFIGKIKEDGSIRLLSRFSGKNLDEVLPNSVKYESLTEYLRVGDRIQVDFLINVPDFERVVNKTSFCKDLPDLCVIGEMTRPFQAAYGGFWYNKRPLPAGIALNAIMVSKL